MPRSSTLNNRIVAICGGRFSLVFFSLERENKFCYMCFNIGLPCEVESFPLNGEMMCIIV